MKKKDEQIIKDAEEKNIPIFIFTAKDILSTDMIQEYMDTCSKTGCSNAHVAAIYDRVVEFEKWQNENEDKVKLPD